MTAITELPSSDQVDLGRKLAEGMLAGIKILDAARAVEQLIAERSVLVAAADTKLHDLQAAYEAAVTNSAQDLAFHQSRVADAISKRNELQAEASALELRIRELQDAEVAATAELAKSRDALAEHKQRVAAL